jgi:hypothetical protein
MLMCALDVSEGVQVQRACLLGLDPAEELIHASEDSTLRLGVTAVLVLTRLAPVVAVGGTLGTSGCRGGAVGRFESRHERHQLRRVDRAT